MAITLYINATIITVNENREIILGGAIAVEDNRILNVLGSSTVQKFLELHATLPDSLNHKIVDLKGKIVLPGLINTHSHLAQSLLRGLAEEKPLHSWLCDAIWPLEANYQKDDGYVAARLTIAEMLKSGTTCFLESMLTHGSGFENVVKAVQESGIRACLAKLIKGRETNNETGMVDARDRDVDQMSIQLMLDAHKNHHGSLNNRLHVWAAASTPRGSPISQHREIGAVCRERDIGLTMHCAESPHDLEIFHSKYNMTPVQFCDEAQLTGRKTVLAHMVNLDNLPVDLPILKSTHTTVAHCPNSNLKLASGIARVPELLAGGANVSLGTDGAPCGNTYDMFREMHLAGILHKGHSLDATLVGAEKVLEMATINGARALGLEEDIGSIEVGKKADFIVVNPQGLHCAPFDEEEIKNGGLDPVTVLVYSCTGRDVEMVVVDGQVLVEDGKLVKQDEKDIMDAARKSVKGIRDRSGVSNGNGKTWKYVGEVTELS